MKLTGIMGKLNEAEVIKHSLADPRTDVVLTPDEAILLRKVVEAASALAITLNHVSGEISWKSRAHSLIRKDWESLADALGELTLEEEEV